jgi:signal transduction histidine kinase
MLGVSIDITEAKRAEEERLRLLERERRALADARAALRAREEFWAIAAHELKTPLVALSLHYEAVRRAIARDAGAIGGAREGLLAELDTAGRQVTDLLRLIDRLLDASRMASGRVELRPERFDLVDCVHAVATDLGPELRAAGVEVRIEAEGGPVLGDWDRVRIGQVITNLLSNAAKYGAGRPIDVRVWAAGGRARVTVRDGGIGIDAAHQARIFERFERSAPRKYGGFGLGLFIAREIARAHGGAISVESARGAGATFTLELPAAP